MFKISTSSSLSFNSSVVKYQVHFSTLILISNSNQSLSISVIYKSLLITLTQAAVFISQAVTLQDLFLFKLIHSNQISSFSKINSFKFKIISIIVSLIHGRVEYS
jgi:hypothetical protein